MGVREKQFDQRLKASEMGFQKGCIKNEAQSSEKRKAQKLQRTALDFKIHQLHKNDFNHKSKSLIWNKLEVWKHGSVYPIDTLSMGSRLISKSILGPKKLRGEASV